MGQHSQTPVLVPLLDKHEVNELSEEMEALGVGGEEIGESSGGVVEGEIRLRGRHSVLWS